MEKKKVLFVIHTLSQGGIQHALTSVLDAVDYEKYNVDLLVLFNKTDIIDKINPNVHITVCRDPHDYEKEPLSLLYFSLKQISKALKLKKSEQHYTSLERDYVRKKEIDYIVNNYLPKTHYDTAVSYFYGYAAEFVDKYISADKKIVFSHASIEEFPELHERIYPHFDMIVTGSPVMAQVIKDAHPSHKQKVSVLKYYIDAPSVREKARAFVPELPDGRTVISSCGRLSPEKGYSLAVECARLLKENGYSFFWVHAGDGPLRDEIDKKIKEYGLENDFKILGMLENPFPYVYNSDIFVQPSLFDGNPLSVEEAHILCVPVVETATLGGKFLIKDGENGLLSDINAESLYEKLSRMISDDELRIKIKKNLESIDRDGERADYISAVNNMLS